MRGRDSTKDNVDNVAPLLGGTIRMRWLERHSWWGLVFVAVTLVVFGVTDMSSGAVADPAIPLGLTGMTLEDLRTEGPAAYRMFDFFTRVNGWSLVIAGLLTASILFIPFRRDEPWAWWTMWLLPAWAAGAAVFYVVAGMQPDQPPPPPLLSGPIVAVLTAAILLLSSPRFLRASGRKDPFGNDSRTA